MGTEGNYSPSAPQYARVTAKYYESDGPFLNVNLTSLFAKTKAAMVRTYPLQALLGVVVCIFSLAFVEIFIPTSDFCSTYIL